MMMMMMIPSEQRPEAGGSLCSGTNCRQTLTRRPLHHPLCQTERGMRIAPSQTQACRIRTGCRDSARSHPAQDEHCPSAPSPSTVVVAPIDTTNWSKAGIHRPVMILTARHHHRARAAASPHPSFVPVSPKSSRRKSSSVRSGCTLRSFSSGTCFPFTDRRITWRYSLLAHCGLFVCLFVCFFFFTVLVPVMVVVVVNLNLRLIS